MTLHPVTTSGEPASWEPCWPPCSQSSHLNELRDRLDDALAHPNDPGAQDRQREAASGLLEHLDGLHADDVQVQLLASLNHPEPDEPPRDATGIDCWERFEGVEA